MESRFIKFNSSDFRVLELPKRKQKLRASLLLYELYNQARRKALLSLMIDFAC
jgi:hypothetical protein